MANITSGVYLDPFILSEAELLEIYKKATEHIRNGKMMLQYQGEGTEASYQFTAPAMDIAREARYALKQKNPQKYGYLATEVRVFFA
jgi:hypothetical protein